MNFIEIKQSNFRNIGISALPYTISNSIRGEKVIYLIQGGTNTSIIQIEYKNISNLITALQKIQEESK
jgi:hypothetical protein